MVFVTIVLFLSMGFARKKHPPVAEKQSSLSVADLIVDSDILKGSLARDSIANTDPCLVEEGCLLRTHPNGHRFRDPIERRQLLRFSTRIWNVGSADVVVGRPPYPEGVVPPDPNEVFPPYWEYSGCHGHFHLAGYAVHDLLHADNRSLVEEVGGTKTGFCMRDNVCRAGSTARYDCSNQGITAGCADHYGAELACQWVDITDVRNGRYILRVTVNANRFLNESNYDNNVGEIEFTLSATSPATFTSPQQRVGTVLFLTVGLLVIVGLLAVLLSAM